MEMQSLTKHFLQILFLVVVSEQYLVLMYEN